MKNKNYLLSARLILLSFWMLLGCSVFGQTVKLSVDSNRIEIGDPLRFFIKTELDKTGRVDFPDFKGDTLARFEIIARQKIDTTFLGDKVIFSQYFTASVYDSGSYIIAPFHVFFSDKNGLVDSLFTVQIEVYATAPAVDTSQPIKPIKAPLDVPFELKDYLRWIASALLLIALLIAAFILYKKYKKKPKEEPKKFRPATPPHLWALGELKKLEDEKLWQKDEHKKYYSRLSDILRNYLEYRYDVDAMESTTDEIRSLISQQKIKKEIQNRLLETLTLADFAKFAKMTPLPDQNTRSMENSKAFVQHTKPVHEPPTKPIAAK